MENAMEEVRLMTRLSEGMMWFGCAEGEIWDSSQFSEMGRVKWQIKGWAWIAFARR